MLFKIGVSEENHRPFESELTVDKYTLKMKISKFAIVS